MPFTTTKARRGKEYAPMLKGILLVVPIHLAWTLRPGPTRLVAEVGGTVRLTAIGVENVGVVDSSLVDLEDQGPHRRRIVETRVT